MGLGAVDRRAQGLVGELSVSISFLPSLAPQSQDDLWILTMAQRVQRPGTRRESSLPRLALTLTLKAALMGRGVGGGLQV